MKSAQSPGNNVLSLKILSQKGVRAVGSATSSIIHNVGWGIGCGAARGKIEYKKLRRELSSKKLMTKFVSYLKDIVRDMQKKTCEEKANRRILSECLPPILWTRRWSGCRRSIL